MTRANFFAAITGAVAAVIPGKSETPKVEEFSPKGKLLVVKLDCYLTEVARIRVLESLESFRTRLGCEFLVCDKRTEIYDPAVAPNEAMVERIAERVCEAREEAEHQRMAAVIAEGERELEVFKQRIQEEGSHTYNIDARGVDPEFTRRS